MAGYTTHKKLTTYTDPETGEANNEFTIHETMGTEYAKTKQKQKHMWIKLWGGLDSRSFNCTKTICPLWQGCKGSEEVGNGGHIPEFFFPDGSNSSA